MNPIGLFRPGSSLIHRLPAGVKLLALVLAGIGSVFLRTPSQVTAWLVAVVVLYLVAELSPAVLWQQVRPLWWVLVLLGVFHVLVSGWARAYEVVGVLVGLVLLAALVTLTTRTTALIDVVVRVCRPLALVGVDPERIGLLLSLGIRSVPVVVGLAEEVREAQLARGTRHVAARVRRPARRTVAAARGRARRGARRPRRRRLSPACGPPAVHTGSVTTWRTRLIAEGATPDPRMSLANERTFLAWLRTSLAMIAGGISLDAFVDETIPAGVRVTLSVVLLALGAALAIGSFQRWIAAERAIRRGDELPVTGLAPLVSAGLAIVAVVLILAVLLLPLNPPRVGLHAERCRA